MADRKRLLFGALLAIIIISVIAGAITLKNTKFSSILTEESKESTSTYNPKSFITQLARENEISATQSEVNLHDLIKKLLDKVTFVNYHVRSRLLHSRSLLVITSLSFRVKLL